MLTIRKSDARGSFERGWLRGRPTFSFGEYQDPQFTGFRSLRVLNEDIIAPGRGFGPHSHRDMEILTYIVAGRLAHRDSLTGPHVLGRHELQAMSAGDGIVHSEFNASEEEPSHSLQIWIEPWSPDLTPSYQQVGFAPADARGRLCLLAAPETPDPARTATINQDARLFVTEIGEGEQVTHAMREGRHAWIQMVRGSLEVNGTRVHEGDGVAVSDETTLVLAGRGEALIFDLA